jgi:hypothetical protein
MYQMYAVEVSLSRLFLPHSPVTPKPFHYAIYFDSLFEINFDLTDAVGPEK